MHSNKATLLECFLYWEQKTPKRIFMTQPQPDGSVESYTWEEVGQQVRSMATYLGGFAFAPGTHIALLGKNSAHWIMADLAIWMAGHVTVPLYPTLSAETASYVLEHCEARLLFVGKLDGQTDSWSQVKTVIPQDLPVVALPLAPVIDAPQWQQIVRTVSPLQSVALPAPDSLATILYTSGSTGQSKGVMHTHRGMLAVSQATALTFSSLSDQDRLLSYLPLAHAAERAGVEATSLYFGCRIYFTNSLATFQRDLKAARPTIFISVPRLWTKFYLGIQAKIPGWLLRLLFAMPVVSGRFKRKLLAELGLQDVRVAATGSAPLPEHIVAWYRDLGLELLDCYGMSENFALSHSSRPGEVRLGYVGSPSPGVQCRIEPDGEIVVRSPGQMLGYYKMPGKAESEMTADGFFRTGDRGEIDDKQRLRITGRIKDLFKTGKGKYVVPVPIEQRLSNHPKVEVVCVAGVGQPQPFGLILLAAEALSEIRQGASTKVALEGELAQLRNEINTSLEDHEKLDYLVLVKDGWTIDNGFLTPTMKIRRQVIEERYLPLADSWRASGRAIIWE